MLYSGVSTDSGTSFTDSTAAVSLSSNMYVSICLTVPSIFTAHALDRVKVGNAEASGSWFELSHKEQGGAIASRVGDFAGSGRAERISAAAHTS